MLISPAHRLCRLEPLDELVGLGAGEAAPCLALVEAEGVARLAECGISGSLEELGELIQLALPGWWAGGLAEGHSVLLMGGLFILA